MVGRSKILCSAVRRSKLLLRVTPYDKQKNRRQLYELLKRVETLDIPMCRALEVGTCEDGEYLLYEWIEGEDAEEIIPKLSKQEQYRLGIQAGEILKKIHSIPAPSDTEEWEVYFNRKADRNIGRYQNCPIALEGAEVILDYLSQHRDCLKNRPPELSAWRLSHRQYDDAERGACHHRF